MKRRIAAVVMATGLAVGGFAGTAQAAGHEPDPNCRGKIVSLHAKALGGPMNMVAKAAKEYDCGLPPGHPDV
jgi:hypothetical protein